MWVIKLITINKTVLKLFRKKTNSTKIYQEADHGNTLHKFEKMSCYPI